MKKSDIADTINRYNDRIKNLGFTEEALGWSRGNNPIRMNALLSEWSTELDNSSILDFGCGYGEFYGFLEKNNVRNFKYSGIDINLTLIQEGRKKFPEATFIEGDINLIPSKMKPDFAFCSGVFNHKLKDSDEYQFIINTIETLFKLVNKGVAANFLSDKVEYHTDHNFNSNPGIIIEHCYKLTNNIVLRNDYMPFEFTVFLRKDKVIDREKLIYT